MVDTIIHFMVHNQVFTLFICMALGFAIGDYKIGGRFSIGATVATLVVTLIVGQIGAFPRDEMLGTIFFGGLYVFCWLPHRTTDDDEPEDLRVTDFDY